MKNHTMSASIYRSAKLTPYNPINLSLDNKTLSHIAHIHTPADLRNAWYLVSRTRKSFVHSLRRQLIIPWSVCSVVLLPVLRSLLFSLLLVVCVPNVNVNIHACVSDLGCLFHYALFSLHVLYIQHQKEENKEEYNVKVEMRCFVNMWSGAKDTQNKSLYNFCLFLSTIYLI